MSDRVLRTRDLNRALLARQFLLERSAIPPSQALERLAGLQTQYAPSAYIGLWSRLRDFRRDALTEALVQRSAVQATLMRSTIHTVSAEDFPLFASGLRDGRREWWLRVQRHQVEAVNMEVVAGILREQLARGPCRATDLKDLLSDRGFPRVAWSGAGLWVEMVRVPPSGTWDRRRADLYGLADDWLGSRTATEARGLEHLVLRYLGGFGPASPNDIANWAGLPVSRVLPALKSLELVRYRDERGGDLLDLCDAPLPDPHTPAPVRLLPTWDATLLVHARRTQILPEAYRPLVFNIRTPHSVPTFLVDGAVAGTWRYEKGQVLLEPFERLSPAARRELDDEAQSLAEFHAD